jgi:subtilase family serine protease
VPQVVRTGIEWTPTADEHSISVVLDEEGRIDELFERNNEASVTLKRNGPTFTLLTQSAHGAEQSVRVD